MAHRCARCRQPRAALMERLWNGHNGYRRYKLCDRCVKELGAAAVRPDLGTRPGTAQRSAGGKEWS
jgi:hypothetical protein